MADRAVPHPPQVNSLALVNGRENHLLVFETASMFESIFRTVFIGKIDFATAMIWPEINDCAKFDPTFYQLYSKAYVTIGLTVSPAPSIQLLSGGHPKSAS